MLKNFFMVTVRNLFRQRVYSIINIAGLAIGIACSILILLWVEDELGYDQFIPKSDRLQQVMINANYQGEINSWNSVPQPTYEAMKTIDSHILSACMVSWGEEPLMTVGDKRVIKEGHYVSEEFLEMFEFPVLKGSKNGSLDDIRSIVLTESLAKILFADEDPLGKTVKIDDESLFNVSAVLADVPGNSTFQFDYLLPWKHYEQTQEWVRNSKTQWGNYSFQVFVELNEPQAVAAVNASIKDLLTKNGQTDIQRDLFLHPMEKWHLYSNFENGVPTGGRSDYVQLFSMIAIFILIIACINFMNLSTARSEKRAREVGIRKSLGSSKMQLVYQFIGESMIISMIAFVLAIILAAIFLPAYNDLVDKKLFIDFTSGQNWAFALGLVVITGLVSGSYPAFFLSSFKTLKTLKGSIKLGKGAGIPRKVLVVTQFVFALLLMIGSVVIYRQISLVENRELGYEQEGLIQVPYTEDLSDNYEVLKQELLRSGLVEGVTRSNSPVTSIYSNNFLSWPGKPETQKVMFITISAGYDYSSTMGTKILQGRDFSKEFGSDSSAILVNQAALDVMKLEGDPIGTPLTLWGSKRNLVGVIDNILMGSPYEAQRPMLMVMNQDWISYITVRLKKTDDLNSSLAGVEQTFVKYNPAYPFEYEFVDEAFGRKFKTINLTRKLATIFSILAIFITGLGLFGLASFAAEQKVKEIGIRKVLGASVVNLVNLLTREFSILVLIAFIFASPIAWYAMDTYLDRYDIRVPVDWWIFPAAGLVALLFALLIVSNQAFRAAQKNPVESLRNE